MSKNLEESILEDLKCFICQEYMYPPIYQCNSGHSFCPDCSSRWVNCLKCYKLKNVSLRNYALEAIHAKLTLPCLYASSGCDFRSLGKEIANHQATCYVSRTPCPFKVEDDCEWIGNKGYLEWHLQREHPDLFKKDDENVLIIEDFEDIISGRFIYIISAFGEFFRIIYEVRPSGKKDEIWRFVVHYLGSEKDAKKRNFFYKMTVLRPLKDSTTIIYQSKVIVENEMNAKHIDEDPHFFIQKSELVEFCIDNNLIVIVTIYDNNKNN